MIRAVFLSILFTLPLAICARPQAPAPSPPASAWNALSSPAMDPSKSAHTENVEIVRDRIHITLTDGTIQFVQPANAIVFGAVFRGKGRVQVDPPNPIEAQQLRLFTKQEKLDMPFTDGTFSFTDGLFDEVAKQVKWQPSVDYPADGKTHFKVDLTRTGVPETWKDVIPLYAHVGDKIVKMGNIRSTHPTETVDTTIQGKIDRISINDYEDLLAEVKQ